MPWHDDAQEDRVTSYAQEQGDRQRQERREAAVTDWTPVWFKELTIKGVYGCQEDEFDGVREHDFDMALRLHAEGRVGLTSLVTRKFKLEQWSGALDVASNKGRRQAVKIAFVP